MLKESYTILVRPLVTERLTALSEEMPKYGFEVRKDANKLEIRRAVEEMFNVKVAKVNVMNMPGKVKRRGRHVSRSTGYRKAIVTLKDGYKIELYEGV